MIYSWYYRVGCDALQAKISSAFGQSFAGNLLIIFLFWKHLNYYVQRLIVTEYYDYSMYPENQLFSNNESV